MKKKYKVIIILVVIVLIISLSSLMYVLLTPKIELIKGTSMTINYKQKYKDPGFVATYHNKDLSQKVKVTGHVNSSKLGKYKVTYTLNFGKLKKHVTRLVYVKDLVKPTIELEDNKEKIYVCPNTEYKPKNYKVYDNYDKNLTKKIKISKQDNLIIYTVFDSSGNKATKKQQIIKKDVENPSLNLNGGDIISTALNEDFIDPGYTITDNCDKNIEDKVTILGKVDTNNTGDYELTYKAVDSSKNITTKKRLVKVFKRGEAGTIYLTFDDGPRSGTTNIILDILKEEGVKATFFVTNSGPDELIAREYNEGHTVGLHTASHKYSLLYSSIENYYNDLAIVHDRVYRLTGYDSKIIRFPGGSSNTVSRKYTVGIMSQLTHDVLAKGYKYFDWNINSRDSDGLTTKTEIINQVISKLSLNKVNIILFHDTKTYTRDAIKEIIAYGKANGYYFDSLNEDSQMLVQKVNN